MKKTLTPLLFLLSSCGSLEVQVDVLDPQVVEAEADRIQNRKLVDLALTQSRRELDRYFSDIKTIHRQYYESVASQLLEATQALKLPEAPESPVDPGEILRSMAADVVPELFDKKFDVRYAKTANDVWNLYVKARELDAERAEAPAVKAADLSRRIVQIASAAETVKADFVDEAEQDIRNTIREAESDLPGMELLRQNLSDEQKRTLDNGIARSTNKAEQALDIVKTSLIGQGSLFQDRHAYAVADATDEMWASHYNRVFGKGAFGNLNVAIKMNSPADFTLKGLTFDPSQVASIAAKVSTQALLVATQIAGVPVDVSSGQEQTDGAGAGLAASSGALASLQIQLAQAEAKRQDYQDALVTIGLAITREADDLESATPDDCKRIAEAILSTFEAHKGRLSLVAAGSPATEN